MVETFLGQHVAEELWIGRGQCVDHYGAGEAYLPVLEALGRLCREERGDTVIGLLRQHAPTWLVQMPALLNEEERTQLQRQVQGATQERMLREFAEALEVLTAEQQLILRLEDLHWSDHATVALLSTLARRTDPARLLILGTYRPAEVLAQDHPLKELTQELLLHDQCHALSLAFLSEAAIGEYFSGRFGIALPPTGRWATLVQAIHRRTEGNPLFMVKVVEDLLAREVISQNAQDWALQDEIDDDTLSIPATARQLIDQQFAHVSAEEQAVLEAASVAGAEFSAAAVAAAIDVEQEAVERCCDTLARQAQFFRMQGVSEWPDGTIAAQYRFIHALYQEVVYERLTVSRRARLHRLVGDREAIGYGEQTAEIAAKLAVHFEQGRAYEQAIQYYEQAGQRAAQRSANIEAASHFRQGLELLRTFPDTPERNQRELHLQIALGRVLMSTKGYASPETRQAYAQARTLCEQLGENPQLFTALFGLSVVYFVAGEHRTARELAEQCLRLAQRVQHPTLFLWAHVARGEVGFNQGEFALAQEHTEQGIAVYDPQQHSPQVSEVPQDPGGICRVYTAAALWFRGYPDQAIVRIQEALALARELAHPFSLGFTLMWTARIYQYRREVNQTHAQAEEAIALSTDQEFPLFVAEGTVLQGWALAEQASLSGRQSQREEGTTQTRQGIAGVRATGAEVDVPYYLALLAETYGRDGQATEGLAVVGEALAMSDKNEERFYEAELYRLKGELTLQSQTESLKQRRKDAEACFSQSLEAAQRQKAKSLELRAAISLARLWQQQRKQKKAHALLAPVYDWFTEGFDTPDLQAARALMDELA